LEGSKVGPLVFVLEEIQHFASPTEQSLLYTLFEASVSGLPVLVLGTTLRYDIISMFEKRVKSRFSQLCIQVPPPADFGQWLGLLQEALLNPAAGVHSVYNRSVMAALQDKELLGRLEGHFLQDRSLHPVLLRLSCIVPASLDRFRLDPAVVSAALSGGVDDEVRVRLAGFSLPMLVVLVCVYRLRMKSAASARCMTTHLTFEGVWREYGELLVLRGSMAGQMALTLNRELLLLAWTGLTEAGILRRLSSNGPAADTWCDPTIDRVTLGVPLGDLVGRLKDTPGCPEYLVRLASFD
jgi:hypothetical protein